MLDWVLNMPLHMIQVFTERIFTSRLLLIKTNTTLNSGFYKIFEGIYFLRWEIKRDITQTSFHVFQETDIKSTFTWDPKWLKPVWNLKPLWNVVPFTWQFTWRFHCSIFPNNSKTLTEIGLSSARASCNHALLSVKFDHSQKKQIVWKHGPNCPFYALMLRTKLY